MREDLGSLCLLGAPHMKYVFNEWNRPKEPISPHPRKGGGLWVAPTKSAARGIQRYMKKKYGIETRIFSCKIDGIIHATSCRVKTAGLFFTPENEILK